MSELLIVVILGIVEGLTEFLPVSSTGHLILFNEALSFNGERAKTFDVVIQLGAILSVLVLFRERFRGFIPKSGELRSVWHDRKLLLRTAGMAGLSGLFKLGVVTAPAVVIGGAVGGLVKQHLFAPLPVAAALAFGALVILLVERRVTDRGGVALEEITWQQCLLIGVVQCAALWPGMSRSAAAIIGGLLVGLRRGAATEFSFLAAVPVLAAAAVLDLFKAVHTFSAHDGVLVVVGFLVSFITALAGIRVLLRIVGRWGLTPFAYYRLVVAAVVVWCTVT